MTTNKEIAKIFYEMADVLDIKGDNPFRINALRRGGQVVDGLAQELSDIYKNDIEYFNNIHGLGEGLRKKIIELVLTGRCKEYEDLLNGFPSGLLDILRIRGVGPKKVKLFYESLGIKNPKDLKKACEKKLIQELPKMGEKSQTEILEAIKENEKFSDKRFFIDEAYDEAIKTLNFLKDCPETKKIQYAGSLRRFKESIGDIDILVTTKNNDEKKVFEHFLSYPKILKTLSKGETKASVVLLSGIQVDLRVVVNNSFGTALHYFTGDKNHNIKIRDIAKKMGLKINEYGIYKNNKLIGGKDEKDVFDALHLPFIPPEIRRDDGEIEYAIKNKKIPKFVDLKDIIGDLHIHSFYSDGKVSMEEMVLECIKNGFEYMGFSDHSSLMTIVSGMDEEKIEKQWKEIDLLKKKFSKSITIFKSAEVDIRKDGELDMPVSILKKLDYVIASLHLRYKLDRDEQTKRLIKAISSKQINILAHPTGRKINESKELDVDFEKVFRACVDNNVVIEINCNPIRLDLYDKYIIIAKEMGAKFCINTDAHYLGDFENLKFGVGMAKRGWLEAKDVINTFALEKLKNVLQIK